MDKKTVEIAIKISKDIDALKKFINDIKDNINKNPIKLRIKSMIYDTIEYTDLQTSRDVYNDITNDFVSILEVKLQQLEKELENL